jgi:hypothetical protein
VKINPEIRTDKNGAWPVCQGDRCPQWRPRPGRGFCGVTGLAAYYGCNCRPMVQQAMAALVKEARKTVRHHDPKNSPSADPMMVWLVSQGVI